jgi:hypothetical protein
MKTNADRLHAVEELTLPDPRSADGVMFEPPPIGMRKKTLADHHAEIAPITLITEVPEKVRIQFDTARNLFVYAWFAYRFFPVAEHQALTCLELGLRERFGAECAKALKLKWPRLKRPPMLADLLKYAHETGHLRGERFSDWDTSATVRARERVMLEKIEEMEEQGLTSIEYDESAIAITEADRDLKYVLRQMEILPKTRNDYAHGSTALH